jgi:hypothetical protein
MWAGCWGKDNLKRCNSSCWSGSRRVWGSLLKTAVDTGSVLGSSPTLCRLERRSSRADVVGLNGVLVDPFVGNQTQARHPIILDVDAPDIALHGDQGCAEFHGNYDHYCYLPLYVL